MTIVRNEHARTAGSPTDHGEATPVSSPANFPRQPNTQAVEGQEATAVRYFAGLVSYGPIEDDTSQAPRQSSVSRSRLVQLTGTSSGPAEPTTRPSFRLPSLAPTQEAKAYLSGDMTRIATGIEGIVRNVAQLAGADVKAISVTTRRFRGAKHRQVKFTIHSDMNPVQALAFWDAIGVRIDDWSSRLTVRTRRILNEETAISVEWVE